MKKFTKMLAFASLASLAVLSGCSDAEEPDPTKAELCAAGVSRDCLMGTWNFNGVVSREKKDYAEGLNFSGAPGSLQFYVDKEKKSTGAVVKTDMFKLALSPNDMNYGNPDCNPIEGMFNVEGPTVKLSITRGNLCIGKKTLSFDPTMTNDGATIKMDVGRVWLTANQVTTSLGVKEDFLSFYTEVYSIPANQK
ncbi:MULTISPECIES: hypothetical protein [unclassified Fibrobacter]|uniref:hypothetical protein n=1 Tax=unclassified Fibrobacter TaxID=2634177 RepID=UPI000D6D471C|nr:MULTISPECIES: hypothetical protein [unclassified Fibrobacter]PWJ69957.1 hypothetical protein BGX12_10435 [Fibrobacter sp. UWR4]PZW73128.1 hypothetical protein C8E88_100435 [Fibrobacter sp. UWR1]